MTHPSLSALKAEIDAQNTLLAEARCGFEDLGDVVIDVPDAFFEEMDRLSATPAPHVVNPLQHVRA